MAKYTKKVLDEKVKQLLELERQIDELSDQVETIKDQLKSHMTKMDITEMDGKDWKVTWNTVESNRFSQSEFSKDMPELYESYKRVSTSRRFVVK